MNPQQEKEILTCRHPNKRMKLIIRYAGEMLYSIIRPVVKTHAATDDVMQEVLLKIHKNIDGFKGKSSLSTWLYRIALNEALQWKRKYMKMHVNQEAEINDYLINLLRSDPYFSGGEPELILEKAMENLPEQQAMVFRLKYFSDLTYKEIAQITGLAEGTLKTHYHLAVKKIKNYIHQHHE